MRKTPLSGLLLLLSLALPPSAWAQPEFPVSCEKVTRIRIWRVVAHDEEHARDLPLENGEVYFFSMRLTDEASAALQKLREATPTEYMEYKGRLCAYKNILVTAKEIPLRSVTPVWNSFKSKGITIPMAREEDALEAARRVCPALEPERLSNERPSQ
ncbi:hypothetical protein [Desulfovibrio aminophilus]|uniref:hypothetical protein n=1 Tax=Desulfovibrio aminophilus TaxID=81425 RepID=UPI00339140E2